MIKTGAMIIANGHGSGSGRTMNVRGLGEFTPTNTSQVASLYVRYGQVK
jgi:hypothetical protein